MTSAGSTNPLRRWLGYFLNLILCVGILAGAVAAIQWIYRTEPQAQKIDTKRRSAALVETIAAERGTWSPQLVVLGNVRPAQEVTISPRVRGQVLELADEFVPGGMVRAGDTLLKIDPADFANTLSIRQSELEQVQASWEIEEGRQNLAKQELELLGDSIDEVNRALVLREPQAASIQSQLAAAKAAVQRAELDLERTELQSPFDATVLQRNVNVGSQVQPGDNVGQLVGVDEYWVFAAVPVRHLKWIEFENSDQPASQVTLHDPDAWGPDTVREGRVARMIGTLDAQTRLARVLVTVSDPLGRASDVPPLILDTLLELRIEGKPIEDVVRLSREYVHDGDTVWVMVDGQLQIRETEIVYRDPQFAYIRTGLNDGDRIVTTTLATVADGVLLREMSDADSAAEDLSDDESNLDAPSDEGAQPADSGTPADRSDSLNSTSVDDGDVGSETVNSGSNQNSGAADDVPKPIDVVAESLDSETVSTRTELDHGNADRVAGDSEQSESQP